MAEAEVEQDQAEEQRLASNWEFIDRVPTVDDVRALLESLPNVYGARYVDYLEYVQALPANKKIEYKVRMPNGSVRKEADYREVWNLYMSVAGRVKMINDIASAHGWQVDFEPEPETPTGAPGFISLEQRIVYREYVTIRRLLPETDDQPSMRVMGSVIGRKPGVAGVAFSGGQGAAGTNPYEKVETAARGRAIAAWGIGVLPGSGIASVDEMYGVPQNQQSAPQDGGQQQGRGRQPRMSREDLMQQVLATAEEMRQARGMTEDQMSEKLGLFLQDRLGIAGVYAAEAQVVDWEKVKDGQMSLLLNSLQDGLREIRMQEQGL